jgi:hypothetical protein
LFFEGWSIESNFPTAPPGQLKNAAMIIFSLPPKSTPFIIIIVIESFFSREKIGILEKETCRGEN